MDHNLGIVLIFTVAFALASVLAYIAQRIKLSPILGYLLAGFIIGPYSPGYVADTVIAEQLAEIGVVLMLFGVGLHFKLQDLINVKNIAIPGATIQTLVATVAAVILFYLAGWPLKTGLIIGLAIGVASTVVLVRVLMDNHLLNTPEGHVAVGWLIVEDIFTVVILIMLPTFAELADGADFNFFNVLSSLLLVVLKFAILGIFMFTWGQKIVVYIMTSVARLRSQELFTLTVMGLVFLIATGSTVIFGTSIALGAFIAGMVLGNTHVKHQAAANALPIKDIFAIIFFISVGMIFNPQAIVDNHILFLGMLAIIVLIKPIVAYLITIMMAYPIKAALTVAFALAQIGEFSFILAEEALKLKLLPDDGYDLLVACALVSISLNPLLFRTLGFFEQRFQKAPLFNRAKKQLPNHNLLKELTATKVVVVGFGAIGKSLSFNLKEMGFTPSVIENCIDTVSEKEEEETIIFGEATDENILREAHIKEASLLVITIYEIQKIIATIHAARQMNPAIKIVALIQFISEKQLIEELDVHYICTEQEGLKGVNGLVRHMLSSKF